MMWMVSVTLRPLYTRERLGTLFIRQTTKMSVKTPGFKPRPKEMDRRSVYDESL